MSDLDYRPVYAQIQAQFGQKGHEWLTSASGETAAGKVFYAVQATEETVISYTDAITATANASKTIPAGFVIYGELTLITITSGTVVAYLGDFIKEFDQ